MKIAPEDVECWQTPLNGHGRQPLDWTSASTALVPAGCRYPAGTSSSTREHFGALCALRLAAKGNQAALLGVAHRLC